MKESKYKMLCENIESYIGGKDNISIYTHCVTRLRFNVKDRSKVNVEGLKNTPAVIDTIWSGDQIQLVIGSDVETAFSEVGNVLKINESEGTSGKQKLSLTSVMETISGCITPVLPLLIGAGMLQIILLLLSRTGILAETSDTYQVLSFVSFTSFWFMPVFVGAATARKFGLNMWMGMFVGAMLIHPSFTSMVDAAEGSFASSIYGLPIYSASYAATFFPTLLSVIAASYLWKFFDRISPKFLKPLFVPTCTMLLIAPLAFCVLGPIGEFAGEYLTMGILWLYEHVGFLGVAIMAALLPLMVMTGMHHALSPYLLQSFATLGWEPIVSTANILNNVDMGIACMAVALKSKDKDRKAEAFSCGISAVIAGISEPAMYGVALKYQTPLYSTMIANFIGGAVAGLLHVICYAYVGSNGLFGITCYMSEDISNILFMILSVVIGMAASFIVTMILYKEPQLETETNTAADSEKKTLITNSEVITAPMAGQVIAMKDVPDATFAGELLGRSRAINPADGKCFAPVDGTVVTLFPTLHAIELKSDEGAEILIHIGINTVELNGKGFIAHVKQGQRVHKGDLLVEADLDTIKKAGYSTITSVIVTNTTDYASVTNEEVSDAALNTPLLALQSV